ncbi:hypothetical protein KC340_g5300 [Hortaea werneckii]|nr:hypothetical protein KC342_g5298 [Hortaea werneckii]KAI7101574.1 hypothetical protein KC339_g6650 [Hortaea werneckii]KAI7213655.1 hypothetical protein KC365_g14192 [Hortaea werneckii]KAI7328052.1 hypothetical protein KC340_g5300 [Hortaea werneckii]KAI7379847.1 hypothetical protein KC328_g13105 [Hortaea werneckii]
MGRKKHTGVATPKESGATSLVSQAIRARTQLSPSFAAEDSEPHVKGAAVARRGPLRDLDPNNVLPTPATQPSLKVANSDDDLAITDEDEAPREPPRSTRATRSGRRNVNYDMKYHPMDEVTRPKRAAKRIPASCPPKTSIRIDLEISDASSNTDLDFPSGDDESELESKNSDIELVRKPDPRATRHSVRSEARKAVNYSRKHHPQDHGLPGFQRRAKRIKLEHSGAVRKKSHVEGGLDDDDIGNLQQRSDSLKESDIRIEGHVDEQKRTIDDSPIHSQSLGGSEEDRPDPKTCGSFENDSEAVSIEDAGIATSTDNESAHGDRMNESGIEQFDDMDYLGLFPAGTYDNPEAQTSSFAASSKKEMVGVEEQVQLNRADASLTIVKPYFSGYQGYVLNPRVVPFELSRATMVDHAPSQRQDFDQSATGSLLSRADTTSDNGMPKDSQFALESNQETAPQASLASTSFACFEESSVNQRRASRSSSSNTLCAVDDSTPGVLAPSLNLDDTEEGRGSMHSDIPVSAQPQQPSVEDADVHELFPKYASDTHGSNEDGNDLLSPLLLSLGQNGSTAIQATTGDSELPSTCAQSFASAEDASEAPRSGQGDH